MIKIDNHTAKLGNFQSNIVDRNLDFAYIAIAKASNTSVRHALLGTIGLDSNSIHKNFPVRHKIHDQYVGPFHHERMEEIHAKRPSFIFSVVRNPWSRIISCYRDKFLFRFHEPFSHYGMKPNYSFSDFVNHICDIPDTHAEIHFRSQLRQLFFQGQFMPNTILRTEQISNDWCIIQSYFESKHNIKLQNIGNFAKRSDSTPSFCITDREIELIGIRYRDDAQFFGYLPPMDVLE